MARYVHLYEDGEKERARREHLDWCKTRALEYLPGDPAQAGASFMSDIMKWEDDVVPPAALRGLLPVLMLEMQTGNTEGVRRWIEGWN